MTADPTAPAPPASDTLSLHRPGDPTYDRLTRPWNLAAPVRPAAVAAPANADDVVAALRFAAANGLRVAVQSTGHGGTAGIDATVLLVWTGGLDGVEIGSAGTARVGAGVRWREVVEASAPYGLAPLAGSALGLGVVGYLTGGGLGPIARTFGFASDLVTALEVVTPDGVLRRATPTQHEDLFWGLRGGKGALGVVTAVELELVPVVSLYGGAVWFDLADARAVLEAWRGWTDGLPEAATTSVALVPAPRGPGGRPAATVRFAFVGDAADGEAHLAAIRRAATPLLDGVGVLPYDALDEIHDDPVDPVARVERSALLADLPGEAVRALLAHVDLRDDASLVDVEIRHLGGALARPGAHSSALSHRDAAFSVRSVVTTPDLGPDPLVGALAPWTTGGALANFDGGVRAYDDVTLARLRELVAAYDPTGLLLAGDPLR